MVITWDRSWPHMSLGFHAVECNNQGSTLEDTVMFTCPIKTILVPPKNHKGSELLWHDMAPTSI